MSNDPNSDVNVPSACGNGARSLLRRIQIAGLLVFGVSALATLALGLCGIWMDMPNEGLFGKLLATAMLVMLVSALLVSAARIIAEKGPA